jgi:Tetraspanin family.
METDKDDLMGRREQESPVSLKLKYFLLAFSMFFWLIGGIFAAVGGYVVSQKTGFEDLSDFSTDPGIILAALGCIIFVISSFGVLGSLRENICLLKTYKYLLVFTLVFEFIGGLMAFAFWPEVRKMIDRNLSLAVEKYTSNVDLRNMIDKLQRELECCGSLTIDDWDSNPYFSCKNRESYRSCGVPWSCCLRKYERNRQCGYGVRKNRVHVKLSNEIYTIGCLDKGFEFFKNNMMLVAGLTVAFTLPLLIGIFLIHIFCGQIQSQLVKVNKDKIYL